MKEEQRRKIFNAIQDLKTIVVTTNLSKFRLYCRDGRYWWKNKGSFEPTPIPRSDIIKEIKEVGKHEEIKRINIL